MTAPFSFVWMAAEYVTLNAKSGEPEGLPDLARAAYSGHSAPVKEFFRQNVRKERPFFPWTRSWRTPAQMGPEHMFYDGRSLN